jgi:hypothetical protein
VAAARPFFPLPLCRRRRGSAQLAAMAKIYFPIPLDSFLLWGYIPRDGSGKEGTVSTASRNCRNRLQRLQERGTNAPRSVGSLGLDPWALRPMRLQWQNNPSGKHQTPCDLGLCQSDPKAKTAAFQGRALSQTTLSYPTPRICRLEARAGTSPPPSSSSQPRAPP